MADPFSPPEELLARQLAALLIWSTHYGERGRVWFAKRMIVHHRPPQSGYDLAPVRDAARTSIEETTQDFEMRVSGTRGGSRGERLARPEANRRLAQIFYGLVGNHPDVFLRAARAANSGLFEFVIARRLRVLESMALVNGVSDESPRGFGYAEGEEPLKVNDAAAASWEGISAGGRYPFRLSAVGRANVPAAIEQLFAPQATHLARTLVGCETAANAVHMRTLMAAHNPATLGAHLVAEGPNSYCTVDHAYGPRRSIATDPRLELTEAALAYTLEAIAGSGADVMVTVDRPWHLNPAGARAIPPGWQRIPDTTVQLVGGADEELVIVSHLEGGANGTYTGRIRIANVANTYPPFARFAPNGVPVRHAVSDSRPDRTLFEQAYLPAEQLQVGDHVYATNHPLYPIFEERGAWQGEHSFIMEMFEQDQADDVSGLRVSGHGLGEQPLQSLVGRMLIRVNGHLDTVRRALTAALDLTPDPGDFVPITAPVHALLRQELQHRLGTAVFRGSVAQFTLGALGPYMTLLRGNLNGQPIPEKSMIIVSLRRRGLLVRQRVTGLPERKHGYDLQYWDWIRGMEQFFPLYYRAGERYAAGAPRSAVYADLPDLALLSARGEHFTIRPRVDGRATYRQWLTGIGAIPP